VVEEGSPSTPQNKYVAPYLRGKTTDASGEYPKTRGRDDAATIRVTNVNENTTEHDLNELFAPYGPISRIFLGRKKFTHESKGFAFINFIKKEHAERAMASLQGFGFQQVILHLEWAKPSGPQ